jgi:hypothetical protein
MCTRKPTITD